MNQQRDLNSEESPAPGPKYENAKNPHYRFSKEEMRAISECNKESFFQRSLPLGTALGVGVFYGVKSGYFRPSPRFGALPKVSVAVIIGYFIGKFSYQAKCAEKLMKLPNSRIGEMLRQRRKGFLKENLEPGFGPGLSLAPFSDMNPSNQYSDLNPSSDMDLDTNRPQYDGLDDSHRPSMDNPIYDEEMPPVQKETTTYEELRRKNRDEFQQKRTGSFRQTPENQQGGSYQQQQGTFAPEVNPNVNKNKYGDRWE